MGGTGNLPVLPGYQPGVRAWVSLLAPEDIVSTGVLPVLVGKLPTGTGW